MNDGIIEINTNDTDGMIASLSSLSGEISSVSPSDIICSCGEINSLCGGAISAAISKLNANSSDASSTIESNNSKIQEIVEDMINFDVIESDEPFSFEDIISYMSIREEKGHINRADEQFFIDAGYEVTDGIVTISGEDGTYSYDLSTNRLTLPNGEWLEVCYYIPDNWNANGESKLNTMNSFTCLAGQKELDVYSSTKSNDFCLDSVETNSILVMPSKKGQTCKGVKEIRDASYSFMSDKVIGATKFAQTFSKQELGCQNIIGGCSSGGGSALKIAAQGGDLYDTVVCINYAPLIEPYEKNKGLNGTDNNRLNEELVRNLNGKNLFFISSSSDPNISGGKSSYMGVGLPHILELCPDSDVYFVSNTTNKDFSYESDNYHRLDSDFWNEYAKGTCNAGVDKGVYSGHGAYHGLLHDLLTSGLMGRNSYNTSNV